MNIFLALASLALIAWQPTSSPFIVERDPRIAAVSLSCTYWNSRNHPANGPCTNRVDVTRVGAKCDAVTTGAELTRLNEPVTAGSSTFSVASTSDIVPGAQVIVDTGDSEDITYVAHVAGNAVTIRSPIRFNHSGDVQVYVAGGYVSGTDDTVAMQAAMRLAARRATRAHPATVVFPRGRCAISRGIHFLGSDVNVAGAGSHATMLVAMPNFGFDPATTPRGIGGQYTGMLDLNQPEAPVSSGYNQPQPPRTHIVIHDIGFDPRAAFNTNRLGQWKFMPITNNTQALQYLYISNVTCDLGTTLVVSKDYSKYYACIELRLGADYANNSHDLIIRHIHTHNGIGDIQLTVAFGYLSRTCEDQRVTDTVYNISIGDIVDDLDLNNIDDDRVVVDAMECAPGGRLSNVMFSGHRVTIAPSVTNGGANGFHMELLKSIRVDHVVYENVLFQGSPRGAYERGTYRGSGGVFSLVSGDGIASINHILLRNIHADYSNGGLVSVGAIDSPLDLTIANVSFSNVAASRCLVIATSSPPTGSDSVHVSNVSFAFSEGSKVRFAARQGILLEPFPSTSSSFGFTGNVSISDSKINDATVPIYVLPTARANINNIVIRNTVWNAGTPLVPEDTRVHV